MYAPIRTPPSRERARACACCFREQDPPPCTGAGMAGLLVQTLGLPGGMPAKKEAEDTAKGKQHTAKLGEAVRATQ